MEERAIYVDDCEWSVRNNGLKRVLTGTHRDTGTKVVVDGVVGRMSLKQLKFAAVGLMVEQLNSRIDNAATES